MIDPLSSPDFPNNVVKILATVLPSVDSDCLAFDRPLRPTDPDYGIGVFAQVWSPEEDSYEMKGSPSPGPNEPTLSRYQIGIQTLTKHGDTDQGLAISSILAKRVRVVLYRNQPLRLLLAGLSVSDSTSSERMKKWGIRNQRFMSNEIDGKYMFLSVLDFYFETETS